MRQGRVNKWGLLFMVELRPDQISKLNQMFECKLFGAKLDERAKGKQIYVFCFLWLNSGVEDDDAEGKKSNQNQDDDGESGNNGANY